MDITKLSDHEVADLAINLVDLLSSSEPLDIDPTLRAVLIAELGTLPIDFADAIAGAAIAVDERKSATSQKNATRGALTEIIRRTEYVMKAFDAPKSQFDLARFAYPEPRAREYIARNPSEISVVGYSNGTVTGRFSGNNRYRAVTYEVWRRDGDSASWKIHIITKRQTFKDENAKPGRYYEYRVRARAAKNVSDFSNAAVVYGRL